MKPTEEQIKRLMYLIELPAMMDDESVGDRFNFKDSNGKKFILDFLDWIALENYNLFEKIEEHPLYWKECIECIFWFDNLSRPEELEYESFRECARYILLHTEAFEGVIKEIAWFIEDDFNKEYIEEFEWWDDIARGTGNLICSLEDAKREFEILKKDYECKKENKT